MAETITAAHAQTAITEREALFQAFGQTVAESTTIDLRIVTDSDEEHFFEMKSAKPNKGQCIEMKTRLLTALAIRRQESTHTWWGVPYNPYGRGEYRWMYPLAFFDFEHEVMLGAAFWDFVGGTGTYDALVDLYGEVGSEFAERIRREYSLAASAPGGVGLAATLASSTRRPQGRWAPMWGCSARTVRSSSAAGRCGSSSRSAAVSFSA